MVKRLLVTVLICLEMRISLNNLAMGSWLCMVQSTMATKENHGTVMNCTYFWFLQMILKISSAMAMSNPLVTSTAIRITSTLASDMCLKKWLSGAEEPVEFFLYICKPCHCHISRFGASSTPFYTAIVSKVVMLYLPLHWKSFGSQLSLTKLKSLADRLSFLAKGALSSSDIA